ncbi:MAG: hypothetical protein LLF99_02765, partial [Desulfobacteraceae bacterium]|nr:hypothetical protein [Desulfobacteraceae bacterium]
AKQIFLELARRYDAVCPTARTEFRIFGIEIVYSQPFEIDEGGHLAKLKPSLGFIGICQSFCC